MPNVSQIAELLLSVSGTDAVRDLNDQLGYTQSSIDQLKQAFSRGDLSMDEFVKTGSKLTAQERALKDQIDAVTAAMNKQAVAADDVSEATAASVGKVGKAGGESAYKLMQMGQTLDDLQYVGEMGLRPIINNVMQMDAKLGIALVTIEFLYRAVGDKLVKAFTDFIGSSEKAVVTVDSLAKKIEELESKPHKLAVDYADLDRAREVLAKLKAEKEAFDAARADKPVQDLGSAVQGVTSGYLGGSPSLTGTVMGTEEASGFKHGTGADQARLAELDVMIRRQQEARDSGRPFDARWLRKLTEEREEIRGRNRAAAFKFAESEVGQFNAGDEGAIQRMKNRAAANPGAFAGIGADGLTGAEAIANLPASPADMRRRTDVDAEIAATDARDAANLAEYRKATSERAKRSAEVVRAATMVTAGSPFGPKVQKNIEAHAAGEQELRQLEAKRIAEQTAAAAKARAAADAAEAKERDAASREASQRAMVAAEQSGVERAARAQGFTPDQSHKIAEQAVWLARNQGIPLAQAQIAATQQLLGLVGQMGDQYQQMQSVTQGQLRRIQAMQNRMRTLSPTTQPMPFATP